MNIQSGNLTQKGLCIYIYVFNTTASTCGMYCCIIIYSTKEDVMVAVEIHCSEGRRQRKRSSDRARTRDLWSITEFSHELLIPVTNPSSPVAYVLVWAMGFHSNHYKVTHVLTNTSCTKDDQCCYKWSTPKGVTTHTNLLVCKQYLLWPWCYRERMHTHADTGYVTAVQAQLLLYLYCTYCPLVWLISLRM